MSKFYSETNVYDQESLHETYPAKTFLSWISLALKSPRTFAPLEAVGRTPTTGLPGVEKD
jgi:hypothetical protein